MTEPDPRFEGTLTNEQARALGIDPEHEYGPDETLTTEELVEALGPEVKIAYEALKNKKDN